VPDGGAIVHPVVDSPSPADFEPLVGQRFELVPPTGGSLEIVLTSCQAGVASAGDRVPVSRVFHAGRGPVVGQQICRLRHPELGELELFVVPIGPDPDGMRYEIIFA
jgi:hypothetical protein